MHHHPQNRERAINLSILSMSGPEEYLQTYKAFHDLPRIRGWSRSVVISGMKITTAEFYLKNAANFVGFLESTPLRTCRLTKVQLKAIHQELTMGIKTLQRRVTVHQMATKRTKVQSVPSREDLRTCIRTAEAHIPKLDNHHEKMEAKLTHGDRFMFYGYLSAYWSCLYSHRPGVYTNLTDQEFEEARASGGGFLLHVKEHKTNKTFGEAQIFLTPEEFSWVERWVAIKAQDGYSYL
ncbi:uncharacterized protein AKAME5_002418600, partial [Lates japonicus]